MAMSRWPDRPLVPGGLMHCKMLTADWTSLNILQRRAAEQFQRKVHQACEHRRVGADQCDRYEDDHADRCRRADLEQGR